MTKFRSAFMMKSPLYEHGEKLRQEAMRLSKESSGRDDAPDLDNPEVVKLLDQAKKANKSHGSDSPVKGYVSDAQRKAVHASKADGGKGAPNKMEAPLEFNAGLRKASADGKLDDNPKFKAAVDAAPTKMKSPLHAPVTTVQGLTSDMYYKPRNEIDYTTMVESSGKIGEAIGGKIKKK